MIAIAKRPRRPRKLTKSQMRRATAELVASAKLLHQALSGPAPEIPRCDEHTVERQPERLLFDGVDMLNPGDLLTTADGVAKARAFMSYFQEVLAYIVLGGL